MNTTEKLITSYQTITSGVPIMIPLKNFKKISGTV
jgi:hypothetical protein